MVSQLPNLQQIALAHNAPPEAQQVLFGQMVADNQRKEDQKVQVVEKKEGIEPLSHDSGGNKNAQQFARQQRHRPSPEAETDTPTQSSNASPWAGNIINVKI
jgi:hypothetical protein